MMRISFNWLKDYVDIRISPEAVAEKLTMAGLEVTSLTCIDQDTVLEIEVTPNRTDCLSMIGIAREVAAITNKKLKLPQIVSFRGKSFASVPIQVQDKKLCPRYLGRAIKNVKVGPSPEWLVQRIEVMGIRTVNNIVDIINFCLLEFGQPLHAFDLDKLQGQRIIVRRALAGEQLVAIDGVQRNLDPTMLVIADKFNPQALAGIMGGKDSEVGETTTNILLESAYFNPLNIHNTSRKLGLATQSSYRFERGVDLEGVDLASLRATELIQKLASPGKSKKKLKGVIIGKLIDKGIKRSKPNKVRLRFAKVNQILGVAISPAQIKDILGKLKFAVVRRTKESITVSVPSFRPDVSREADLIEEVVRLYGYNKIPLRVSQLVPNLFYTGKLALASEETYNTVRQILASCGLNEIISYSLISRQALRELELPFDNTITVKNPLSYEQEILRPTLLVGMLNTLLTNINRNNKSLKLFELSRIYLRINPQSTKEFTNLCIGITGKKSNIWLQKSDEYSFFDLKGIVETLLNKLGLEDFRFSSEESFDFVPRLCPSLHSRTKDDSPSSPGRSKGRSEEPRWGLPSVTQDGSEDAKPTAPSSCFISGRSACLFLGETPGSTRQRLAETSCGVLGEIKREILERFDISYPVYACELQLHKLLAHIRRERRFVSLARFPSIERDISLVAPQEVHSEQIVSLINKIGRELIAKVILFDQYFGEQISQGFRGLAYSIEYRSFNRTLTAEEVDKLHRQIRRALIEELKVQVR